MVILISSAVRSPIARENSFADIVYNRAVQCITCHTQRGACNNAAKGNDSNLACAAADINNHAAGRLCNGQTCTNCRCHGFFNQIGVLFLGACGNGSLQNGALFYLCYAGRHTDYNARLGPKERAYIRLIDEITQHSLCYVKVCDNAVLHGADGNDIAGGTPDHILRFVADSQNLSGVCVDGNNGRLIHDDSFFSHIDKGIGSTQVNSHIFGIEHHILFTPFIIGNAAVCAAAMVSLNFVLTFYHTAFFCILFKKRAVFS